MIHKELFKKFITPKSENVSENRNIVAYTRVSSIGQQDNFSLIHQKEEINAYAKANGYNIIAEFGAKVESASDDMSRKEFKRLYDWVTTRSSTETICNCNKVHQSFQSQRCFRYFSSADAC